LALPLPGYTPLGPYHLRLDHSGLRRTGLSPRGFDTHGARPLPEVALPRDTLVTTGSFI
jgi:hypothetical protein